MGIQYTLFPAVLVPTVLYTYRAIRQWRPWRNGALEADTPRGTATPPRGSGAGYARCEEPCAYVFRVGWGDGLGEFFTIHPVNPHSFTPLAICAHVMPHN